ncbi:MAG: hypothetical protein KDI49_18175 [Gammaproteobacteria bacterium]|nr:hypothetical protein [Gammaproteobacteria bacterium]
MMEQLDTDKLMLCVVDSRYLHLIIHTDEEITADDIPAVVGFLDQFDEPVPILIERQGDYSISPIVQMAMYKGTKRRLKAVAFLDRHHQDAFLSNIAKVSYFQHIKVRSFYNKADAVEWLNASFCTEPIKRKSVT